MMKWHSRFMDLAHHIAQWSKDPSTKVGCVLVDHKRRVVGMGYNGFPRDVADHSARYEERALKYLMVQHAEANAILNAVGTTEGATAYVTHHPCSTCAGLLIQSGVRSIITHQPAGGIAERFKDSFEASRVMFTEAGVSLAFVEEFEEIAHGQ